MWKIHGENDTNIDDFFENGDDMVLKGVTVTFLKSSFSAIYISLWYQLLVSKWFGIQSIL